MYGVLIYLKISDVKGSFLKEKGNNLCFAIYKSSRNVER